MNLGDISWKCVKMDKNVLKHTKKQKNGAQNYLKSGLLFCENSHARFKMLISLLVSSN